MLLTPPQEYSAVLSSTVVPATVVERKAVRQQRVHGINVPYSFSLAVQQLPEGLCCLNWRHGRLRAGVV
jgi:hypothetical protein